MSKSNYKRLKVILVWSCDNNLTTKLITDSNTKHFYIFTYFRILIIIENDDTIWYKGQWIIKLIRKDWTVILEKSSLKKSLKRSRDIDKFQINEINVDLRTSGFDNEVLSVDACAVWQARESFYCLPRIGVVTWHREPRFQCGSARTGSIWNSSIELIVLVSQASMFREHTTYDIYCQSKWNYHL